MAVKIIQDYRRELQNITRNSVLYLSVLYFQKLLADKLSGFAQQIA